MTLLQTQSTVTLQKIVNIAETFGDVEPVLNVAGSSSSPALIIATDVMNKICATTFPHKWNTLSLPPFYTNSWQQDYALVWPSGYFDPNTGESLEGESVTNLSWLMRGICININSTSFPKVSRWVECGRELPQATGTYVQTGGWSGYGQANPSFLANFFPNASLYYGTWGDVNNGTQSIGNNPVAGSAYTQPLGTLSQPSNPITQIQDANGNLLVLTTYGVEGTTAPVAAQGAPAGTVVSGAGATTQWTVVDPQGQGIRIYPVPSQTGVVWQFLLVGQMKPVRFTSLQQTLYPLPDEFETHFRDGFIAQCYRYSTDARVRAKFKDEWALWLASLQSMQQRQDRELEENIFIPDRGIMGGGINQRASIWRGASWPFAY